MNARSNVSARLLHLGDGWTAAEYALVLCLLIVVGAAVSFVLNAIP